MDGCVRHQVANQFEHAEPQNCDYVGLVITYTDSWKFNRDEYESVKHKPFVIFDYTEYGWEHTSVNHFYGYNTNEFSFKFNNTEYLALDEAIKNANVKCYFKRELPKGANSPFNTFPAEYPCILPQEDPVSFESYNARAIAIFFNWGWSNPSRPNLHGALYSMAQSLVILLSATEIFWLVCSLITLVHFSYYPSLFHTMPEWEWMRYCTFKDPARSAFR